MSDLHHQDREQEIFDHAEDIALQLHYLEGILAAITAQLDEPLARCKDKGVQVHALLAAAEHFRAAADSAAARVARAASDAG